MPKSILVVDDDQDDLFIFEKVINDLYPDAALHLFDVGERALEFMLNCDDQAYPDIIFLDINMPVKNGWECLRELKIITTYKQRPIVMFSTLSFETQSVTPSDVGASAFLTKADTIPGLKNKLSELFSSLFK